MKNRPCNGRSIYTWLISTLFTFNSFCITFVSYNKVTNIIFCVGVGVSVVFLMFNIITTALGFFTYNSSVCLYDGKIRQKRLKREIVLEFDRIDRVSLTHTWYLRAPYLLTLYQKDQKISFEITSNVFKDIMSTCKNEELNDKMKKLFKDHDLYIDMFKKL